MDIDIIRAGRLQAGYTKRCAGEDGVSYDLIGDVIVAALDSRDRDARIEHFNLPSVGWRNTLPCHLKAIRVCIRLADVIRLDTRGVFQLYVVNQDIAAHRQRTQTRGDSDIIVCQLIIRQNQTNLGKRAATRHPDRI